MKQLFTIDSKDYDSNWEKFYRPSVRGIILNKNHEIALIYSQKFHIYKFPGGGIEPGEDHLTALARENQRRDWHDSHSRIRSRIW